MNRAKASISKSRRERRSYRESERGNSGIERVNKQIEKEGWRFSCWSRIRSRCTTFRNSIKKYVIESNFRINIGGKRSRYQKGSKRGNQRGRNFRILTGNSRRAERKITRI